jgi:hypothetical protein
VGSCEKRESTYWRIETREKTHWSITVIRIVNEIGFIIANNLRMDMAGTEQKYNIRGPNEHYKA